MCARSRVSTELQVIRGEDRGTVSHVSGEQKSPYVKGGYILFRKRSSLTLPDRVSGIVPRFPFRVEPKGVERLLTVSLT